MDDNIHFKMCMKNTSYIHFKICNEKKNYLIQYLYEYINTSVCLLDEWWITLIFRRKNKKSVLKSAIEKKSQKLADLLYGCRAVALQYTLHVVVVIRVHNAVQAAVHQIHLQYKDNTFYPFEF